MCERKILKERKVWQMILKNKQTKALFPYQHKIQNQFQDRNVEFR